MTEPPDPLPLEALRRDREAAAPDDARARVASRLGLSLARPEPPRRSLSDAGTAGGGAHSTSLVALAFVLGGGVGALLHAGLARPPAPRMVDVERSAPSISSAAPALPYPQASASSTGGSAVPVSPPPVTPAAGIKPAPRTGIPQLDAERALLDAAHAALVGGEADTALDALDRHARAYARPMLGEERDALFVQALVRAGRYDEARGRAEAFRNRTPNSLFRPAVDAAIASIP
jgi:hypothetical protein